MPDNLMSILELPLVTSMLQIILIVALAYLTGRLLRLAARHVERRLELVTSNPERMDRLRTLVQLGRGIVYAVVLVLAGLMVLGVLKINIAPLLAGAGVAGLAISLGAQTLIKDFIGGILILVENQFTEGDVIKVGEISGTVERITLRATYLRDIEGRLHVVPNGDIRLVSNLTSGWARAVVDVNIPFTEDIPKALRALESAARRAASDESIRSDLIEPPQALGWIGINDWSVQVRLMAKTAPGRQWAVSMVLRRYAMEALRDEGVQVAVPTQRIERDQTE